MAHLARRAANYGVQLHGEVGIDIARVMARAHEVTHSAGDNLEQWLGGLRGLTVLGGHARFEAPQRLHVGEASITAPKIFLNVGGRAHVPALPGVA